MSFAKIFGFRKVVLELSCGFVCAILRLAVSAKHRLVRDRQTDTRRQLILALASVARVKTKRYLQEITDNITDSEDC